MSYLESGVYKSEIMESKPVLLVGEAASSCNINPPLTYDLFNCLLKNVRKIFPMLRNLIDPSAIKIKHMTHFQLLINHSP